MFMLSPKFSLVYFMFFASLFIKEGGFLHWRETPFYLSVLFVMTTASGLLILIISSFVMPRAWGSLFETLFVFFLLVGSSFFTFT